MKFFITVKPNAKQEKVEKIDATRYRVSVKAPAKEGKANEAVVKALAEYFNIAPSRIYIVTGHTARHKVIEIL